MAGERTPDTSDSHNSGSSDDDISLREHMQRQIDTQSRHQQQMLNELRTQLDERYQTQTKALDAAFASAEKAVSAALQAAEAAVQKAENAADKRFEAVNEFRGQLSDQAAKFMTRDESLARHGRTEQDITVINSRLDLSQGQSTGAEKFWGYIVGAIGLAGGVVGLILALNN